MPEIPEEPFSNPIAPAGHANVSEEDGANFRLPLTNADFRKLLMTPRAPPQQTPIANSTITNTTGSSGSSGTVPATPLHENDENKDENDEDKAESRKKKKSFYAQLKKEEDDKMLELARKYRDRARERREGGNEQYTSEDPISMTSGYRAVAPDVKSGMDAAERRRQMIQESKFLGGDMEHTHLVKGLDYALLQKVRIEITAKEKEEEELEEVLQSKTPKETQPQAPPEEDPEQQIHFRTKQGKNIYRVQFKSKPPERNDLFLPGRLAYVIDVEDEFSESDIPTTLIRSKADCPSFETHTTLTTNDIVINKLTQILSYLRQGTNSKKIKKKDKSKQKDDQAGKHSFDDSIYGDIGNYVPSAKSSDKERREKDRDKKRTYFEKPVDDDYDRRRNRDRGHDRGKDRRRDSERNSERERLAAGWAPADITFEREQELGGGSMSNRTLTQEEKDRGLASVFKRDELKSSQSSKIMRKLAEPDSYAECYPGAPESADAIDDSDDEVDYTKMDMGNKKGPIGRWDFDTQEEYSDYMNQKEALPKAAFQYGVKMADGRKTRRTTSKKDEKAELDREWQKISQIISKRKSTGDVREPKFKMPKY